MMEGFGQDRIISDEEQKLVADDLRLLSELQVYRYNFENQWEEISALIDPMMKGSFSIGNTRAAGLKNTEHQVDSSGMMALHRFAAICDSLLTPRNQRWHGLAPENRKLLKSRKVRLWFEHATDELFRWRYHSQSNYSAQNQMVFRSLGAYGTASLYIDKPSDGPGLRYKAMPLGQTLFYENHQGVVIGMMRYYQMTAPQACGIDGWKDWLPQKIKDAAAKNSQTLFNFIHHIGPRKYYDPQRIDAKGKPYFSRYISVEGKCMLQEEGGYHTFPVAAPRYEQGPNEVYGRGPGGMVLPALKTLNAEKRIFLKQGHRAADPILLTSDDGLVDGLSLKPGAMNKGGWSADGRPLVGTLPTGDVQITKEMMQDEKGLINDAFLVTLFQILTENPQMTATEVIERVNEKGILIAPTVGRQQSEYIGPKIERELDLLMQQDLLDPMPDELREAGAEFSVDHTSPMSRWARAQEAAGFQRSVGYTAEIVKITGDTSLFDVYDFDTAQRDIALDIQGVRPSWMASDEQVAGKRDNRAKQQRNEQSIQAAPAAAAMMKAQVAASEAGMGQQPGAPV